MWSVGLFPFGKKITNARNHEKKRRPRRKRKKIHKEIEVGGRCKRKNEETPLARLAAQHGVKRRPMGGSSALTIQLDDDYSTKTMFCHGGKQRYDRWHWYSSTSTWIFLSFSRFRRCCHMECACLIAIDVGYDHFRCRRPETMMATISSECVVIYGLGPVIIN